MAAGALSSFGLEARTWQRSFGVQSSRRRMALPRRKDREEHNAVDGRTPTASARASSRARAVAALCADQARPSRLARREGHRTRGLGVAAGVDGTYSG